MFAAYQFDKFQVNVAKRLLRRDGKVVSLNSKTFDLLLVLLENKDRLLTKDELLEKVWANQFVEESNLPVHISALRKVLGETKDENRFIVTVPGQGYRFVAEVETVQNGAFPRFLNGESEILLDESAVIGSLQKNAEEQNPIAGQNAVAPLISPKAATWQNLRQLIWSGASVVLIALFAAWQFGWLDGKETDSPTQQAKNLSAPPAFQPASIKRLTAKGNVQLAALSPDGKLFAYTTADFQQESLWLGYSEGGEQILLRPNAEVSYYWLAFAPDGNSLFYTMSDAERAMPTLYKSPIFGGVQEKIKEGSASSLSISPDGGQIAFVKSKSEEKRSAALMVSNTNGSETRELVSLSGAQRFIFGSVSWSPDGKMIAYSALADEAAMKQNLYAVRAADGQIEQITKNGWGEITRTAWLADGSGLIMLAEPFGFWDSVYHEQIWRVSFPSGETSKITSDLSNYTAALSLSNDLSALLSIEYRQMMNIWIAPVEDFSRARQITFGSFGRNDGYTGLAWRHDEKIVYTSTTSNSQVVSVMNSDGSDAKQITSPGYVDSQLSVSGDGRYVFFHSTRSGSFEIWRMDTDGENAIQLTKGGNNYQSYASPDGKWVYYKSLQDGIGTLWRIPATGGEPQQMTTGECSWAALAPDGKYFACDYRTDKRRLAIFPIDGGQPIKQFEFPASSVRWYGMHWTPDSRAVAFRDGYYGIWKQPIEGDKPPQRIENLPREKIYRFAWSRDGKRLAFTRGTETRDVVLIRGVK